MNAQTQVNIMKVTAVFTIAAALVLCKAAIDLMVDMNKEPPTWQEAQKILDAATRERFRDERTVADMASEQKNTAAILDELLKPSAWSGSAKSGCVYK